MRLSSSASTVMRPVTISQEVNERRLGDRVELLLRGQPPQPPARPILAWQVRAAWVVDRPVLRPAARIAAR